MHPPELRPCESLSKRQREATPPPFAEYLLGRVRMAHGCHTVAVLWVQSRSVYFSLPGTDCWSRARNARRYPGPHPVICHPPCGPWGKYHHVSGEDKEDGRIAVELVERFGGVVEQPVGSRLFRVHRGMFVGHVERVDQSCFGHMARKPTLLYFVNRKPSVTQP